MNIQASTNAIHHESFNKEQVKRRLRAHAVSLWGLQEADADNLDPVIDLLLGACAVEFERTAHHVYASQVRILERLAELMVPEVTTSARPAHAIMHATAEAPKLTLKKESLFSADKEILEGSKTIVVPITFSPVADTILFDATVVCQATRKKITIYDTPLTKGESIYAAEYEASLHTSLWLGLRLDKNNKMKSLKGMSFFFDWKNNPDKSTFIPLLALTEWTAVENMAITVQGGFPQNENETENRKQMVETDMMKPFESQVLHYYQDQFVTIKDEFTPTELSNYPVIFADIFAEDQLKKNLKEELLWLEVRFPEAVAAQAIDDVYCSINCFPVMNRKLHAGNRPFALTSNLNIIPLTADDHFMSVSRIFTASREYHSVTADQHHDMEDGTFAVKHSGVSRFDQRDAEELLHYLYELMRDESAIFKAFGNYAINSEIKGLEQSLARLKMHFLNKSLIQASKCHLFINTKQAEDVWVEFWTSQGSSANLIAAGTKLKPLSQSNTKRTSLLLVTPTAGGREPLNEAEKIHAYRFALLTRSRIATEEDIKAACYAELGDKIRLVEIKKGYKKELTSRSGFVKALDVILTPSAGFKDMDWNTACNELKSYIERNKTFLMTVQVFTTTNNPYAIN